MSYNKAIGAFFSVNIRISQPSKVMFTSASPRWTALFSGWQILMSTSKECINCIMRTLPRIKLTALTFLGLRSEMGVYEHIVSICIHHSEKGNTFNGTQLRQMYTIWNLCNFAHASNLRIYPLPCNDLSDRNISKMITKLYMDLCSSYINLCDIF